MKDPFPTDVIALYQRDFQDFFISLSFLEVYLEEELRGEGETRIEKMVYNVSRTEVTKNRNISIIRHAYFSRFTFYVLLTP